MTVDINQDIAAQIGSLTASASAGTPPGSPNYIGGPFNLNISTSQLLGLSPADQQIFSLDFAGTSTDGVRQEASTGLAAAGGYWLHSQLGKPDPGVAPGVAPDEYSVYFDRFNGTYFPSGTILHAIWDVGWGSIGHHCLEPAWH